MNKPLRKSLFMTQQPPSSSVYLSASWLQHEQVVSHLASLNQNIVLIIAPQEGGKTTFVQYLLSKENGLQNRMLLANAHTSVEELLKQVAMSIGITWENPQIFVQDIHYLQESTAPAFALFIDDAHLLSNEQLQALIQLINPRAPASQQLRLVLLGEPSLELRLFSPEFTAIANGKIYTIELESWTLHDISAYLHESGELHFSKDQIASLFEKSAGLPGFIAKEKMLALKNGTALGKKMTNRTLKLRKFHPISLGVIAGLAIGGSYLIYNHATSDDVVAIAPINAAQTQDENWQQASVDPNKTTPPVAFHFDKVDNSDVLEEDIKQQHQEMDKPIAQMGPQKDMPDVAQLPTPKPESEQKQDHVEVVAKTMEKEPKTTALKSQSKMQTQDKKPTPITTLTSKGLSPQETHLLSMNKKNYTLQLLGASKEASIKQFVQKHGLQDTTYSFHTKRQGKDWYIVVYGNYQSADEAKLAADNLLTTLKRDQIKPWVRDMGAIHKDINMAQG